MKAYKDKNSGTGTRGLVAKASALEKPGTWVRILASVRFFICSVASFLLCCPCEALEGPISTGFAYFNNNVDSKRHIILRTAILYNEINSGQIMKKHYIYICVYVYI